MGNGDPASIARESEIPLHDTSNRRVVRVGRTVRRPVYPWSPAIHALLKHLESVRFPFSPRFLGIDDQGREALTYLPGEAGPVGWSKIVDERGLVNAAQLLSDYHAAVSSWRPDDSLMWPNGKFGGGDPGDIVCHGDFGPWNIVWDGLRPIGLIDFDYAYPAPARQDVVYALEYVVPFRDDDECLRLLAYDQVPDRRRRLEVFAEAYGLDSSEYNALAVQVIEQQRAMSQKVRTLAAQGIEPQASWVAQGYLDVIEQRIRWGEAHLWLFT